MKLDKKVIFKSIRFRVWLIYFSFTVLILIFLYLSQVILMPVVFEFSKTQESISTALEIKAAWNEDMKNVKRLVDENAHSRKMGILINFPSEVTGGLPLTYYSDTSGSSVSIDKRVSDEMMEELKASQNGMIFFPAKDENMRAILLATYVGTPDRIKGYIFIYNYLEPTETTTQILTKIFVTSSFTILLLSFAKSELAVFILIHPTGLLRKSFFLFIREILCQLRFRR